MKADTVVPRRFAVVSSILIILLLAVTPVLAANPGVIPPNSKAQGSSYGEWAARWWQWNYSMPATVHPLSSPDHTADVCARSQSGNVWFLGGRNTAAPNSGPVDVVRDCAVPSGTMLFFPVLNSACSDAFTLPPLTNPRDEAGLRASCTNFMNAAANMSVEVDGVPVEGLGLDSPYRVSSDLFSVTLGSSNLRNVPAGTYGPIVTEGYYIMLAPLSVGTHTLHFQGALPQFNFALDITYHITVLPRGQYSR